MKNKYIIVICLLILQYTGLKSQEFNFVQTNFSNYYFTPQNMGFALPQTAEFSKYGNIGINHYHGLLDMEIPLNGYKDKDFDIPISIKYISEGFKPSKRSSLVGYNWVLNVGGVITREVVGSPDDIRGKFSKKDFEYMPDGLLVAIRDGYHKTYTESEMMSFKMSLTNKTTSYPQKDFEHDFEPDIFRFNFGGYQGTFMIGQDGNIISTNEALKIDISTLAIQSYSTGGTPKNSSIKITTPDGYIYQFGGALWNFEYSLPNNPKQAKIRPSQINAWYLISITAPNQRIARFEYAQIQQKNKYKYHAFYRSYGSSLQTCQGVPQSSSPIPEIKSSREFQIVDQVYLPMIRQITIDQVKIIFSKEKYEQSFYRDESDSDIYRITSIKQEYNNSFASGYSFDYLQKGSFFFLSGLSKIKNDHNMSAETYTFSYNIPNTLPDPQTISTDHWGFWNGGYISSEDAGSFTDNITQRKAVNSSLYNVCLLTEIKYPTSGKTLIEYEHNSYSYSNTKNLSDKIEYKTLSHSPSKVCSGARVAKLTDYDPVSGKENIRTFEYVDPLTNKGTGTIGLLPSYRTFEEILADKLVSGLITNPLTNEPEVVTCTNLLSLSSYQASSISLGGNLNSQEYHVGYHKVIENNSDKSKVIYHYSSRLDTPDNDSVSLKMIASLTYGDYWVQRRSLNRYEYYNKYGIYELNDMSSFRGLLLRKEIYKAQGTTPAQLELFDYNTNEITQKYVLSVRSMPNGQLAYKRFLVPCRVVKKRTIDENNVSLVESYIYNKKGLIERKEIINSDNSKVSTNYKYSYQLPSQEPYKTMIDKNMLSYVTEEKVERDSAPLVTTSIDYFVDRDNTYGYIQPKGVHLQFGDGPIKTYMSFNSYNQYGNPIHVTNKENENVVYLWGGKGRYLIAEIRNATEAQTIKALSEIVGVSSIFTLSLLDFKSGESYGESIHKLYKSSHLKDAQVTTYSHDNLYGVDAITTPYGLRTYYRYDEYGRLTESYYYDEQEKNIIESYNYHYINK